jgi:hypothetical protein
MRSLFTLATLVALGMPALAQTMVPTKDAHGRMILVPRARNSAECMRNGVQLMGYSELNTRIYCARWFPPERPGMRRTIDSAGNERLVPIRR